MNLRVSRIVRHFIAANVLFALTPSLAAAAWQANGIPIAPDLGSYQSAAQLCTDGSGGSYIIFLKQTAGDDADTYVQRITAAGDIAPGWTPTALGLGVKPNTQWPSRLAPDQAGGVFVAWTTTEDPSQMQHRLQRVLPNGTIAAGWPADGLLLPAGGFGPLDGICGDGLGGVFVVWTSTDSRVWMLHYTGAGQVAPGWSASARQIIPVNASQGDARIFPAADGGFIGIWSEERAGYRVIAAKILPSGDPDPTWPANGTVVNSLGSAYLQYKFATPDGAGGLFVAWSDYRHGPFNPVPYYYEVYGQHVLANGTVDPLWPVSGAPIVVGRASQYVFEMASDGVGGIDFVSSGYGIFAVRLRQDGTVAPGWTPNGAPVATNALQSNTWPSAVASGDGGVYTFWEDSGSIFGQQLGPSGSFAPGWGAMGTLIATNTSTAHYGDPRAISDGATGAIVTYERSIPNTSHLICAQRVRADGPVPTRISFLDSEVGPGTARLRWAASDAPSAQALVYRRQLDDPWVEVGTPVSVGESVLEFEDVNVTGGRYGYRLRTVENGLASFTEEVVLDIPSAFGLALAGFQPNPAIGPVSIAFTLPSDEPARVTVHDVRGRVVGSRVVSSLGPGHHRIDMSVGTDFPPGIYWIRLAQGERMVQSRGVVLR